MHKNSKTRLVSAPLALAATLAAGSAFAADIDPKLEAALKRDLGLSGQQLAQYLKTERLAAQQEKALEKQLGRAYAGSWIERQKDGSFKFVVATAAAKGAKAPAGVEVRNVRRSLKDLESAKRQLDDTNAKFADADKAFGNVYSWGVDPKTNSVVVGVDKNGLQAGIDFVAASGVDADAVRFETMDAPALQAEIIGGIHYSMSNGFRCSVGFPVLKGAVKGFATAAHCADVGVNVTIDDGQVGTFAGSTFDVKGRKVYDGDRAWVKLTDSQTLKPLVAGYAVGSTYTTFGGASVGHGSGDVAVKGSEEAAIGAAVCRSGSTSGWYCGTITEKGTSVRYVKGGGTVTGLSKASTCSLGGDSGGSFITSTGQAQGVLSGGPTSVTSCPSANGYSLYQPINPILSLYGLTLVTGN